MPKQKVGDIEFDLYKDQILLEVNQVVGEGLAMVALEIEGQAKLNIRENDQIDTGFMLNSGYTVSREGGSTYGETDTSGTFANRGGDKVKRELAPEVDLPREVEAAVCFGAAYAIFQELAQPFLYRAGEDVAGRLPSGAFRKV